MRFQLGLFSETQLCSVLTHFVLVKAGGNIDLRAKWKKMAITVTEILKALATPCLSSLGIMHISIMCHLQPEWWGNCRDSYAMCWPYQPCKWGENQVLSLIGDMRDIPFFPTLSLMGNMNWLGSGQKEIFEKKEGSPQTFHSLIWDPLLAKLGQQTGSSSMPMKMISIIWA